MSKRSLKLNDLSELRHANSSSKRFAKKQNKKAQREAIFGEELANRLFSDTTHPAHQKSTFKKSLKTTPTNPYLSKEDVALFQQSMSEIQTLKTTKRAIHKVQIQPPTQTILEKRALAEGRAHLKNMPSLQTKPTPAYKKTYQPIEEETFYLKNKDQKDILQKLKKLYWPVESSIDLHGCTEDEAYIRFTRFIQSCTNHHIRCVCIIHGKGISSIQGQPIIKPKVRKWLKEHIQVQAFIEAPNNMGGSGAVLALLEKNLHL